MHNLQRPVHRFYQVLLRLARLEAIDNGDLETSFKEINKAITEALEVQRSSIWFYDEELTLIECHDLYDSKHDTHERGAKLIANDFPAYFNYLKEERTLPATNAHTNPATKEFSKTYLRPHQIESMLDAPIHISGKMIGVICCESVGVKRKWTINEQIFIGNVSDILSRALQAKERINTLKKLELMNANLENLVQERTKELEEQRARSANTSKMAILGEMAGSIAHEINNPLAIILSSLSILKTHELSSESKEKILDNIQTTTLRIDKIVKGLRFFARDATQDSLHNASLKQILEDTLTLCRQKFYLKGCEIIINIPEEDIGLMCQPVSVSQALLNLLGNAYDAIENNSEKWIRIDCTESSSAIEIRVTDSGPGISPEVKEKIMVPFFTTKAIGKGTGLGLPIVKGIVEQHKGIFKYDERNQNTSFIMYFPKHEVKAA